MQILRFLVIIFSLWYLPTFILEFSSETIGSYSSYLMFILIIGYFVLAPKVKPNIAMIILGVTYYAISGLNYSGDFDYFFYKFLKFLIFIIGMSEIVVRVKPIYLFYILLIGALSIIVNALFFPHMYGRYSGFYLNPNLAGLVALIGFCFCFKITRRVLRLTGFIIFIIAGLLTLSRYFILMWIVLSIITIIIDRKNAEAIGIGIGSGIVIITMASILQLNTERFNAIQNILGNQVEQGTRVLSKGSRVQTWSRYTDDILDNLIFGNGYTSLSGESGVKAGVHNSIFLTLGESGIFPLIIMLSIFIRLLSRGIKFLKTDITVGLLSIVVSSYLFVSHNFYDNYLLLFFILWCAWRLNQPLEIEKPEFEEVK